MKMVVLPVLVLSLTACLETKHLRNLPEGPPAPQAEEKLGPEDFVYANVFAKVLSKKCSTCHRAGHEDPNFDDPGNVNLETYENTTKKLLYIKSVVETGVMGLEDTPKLTATEKQLILGWIEANAPR